MIKESRKAAAAPTPPRSVPTRRIDFGFGDVDLPRHFMNDDLVSSHLVAVLSCLFPEGEDFFVQSVRNYRDQITDPELREQVKGFIGQEAIHGREHRQFNDTLAELGYPVWYLDGRVRIGLGLLARIAPKAHQLALTAALEHYTATLAEILLTTDFLEEECDIAEVRQRFYWHALEEAEHKSVAYDVYMSACGNERIRVNVMRVTQVMFNFAVLTGLVASLLGDPATRRRGRLRKSLAKVSKNPILSKEMRRRISSYKRHGFHPDDRDTSELLECWTERLFGEKGQLSDRLKGPSAA